MSAFASTLACIGEPISWLRLERFALERADAGIGAHVAACPACRACLDEIERDVVALPPLHVAAAKPRRRWWTIALPAGLAVAAAALLLVVLRPREPAATSDEIARIKGLGTVELGVVRERDGVIREDVREFGETDRWKVIVTCAADKSAWIDAFVVEAGATRADYPLAPARVVCGNRIALPGAFTLTGTKVHQVCVRVATDAAPARVLPAPGDAGIACVTLRPE